MGGKKRGASRVGRRKEPTATATAPKNDRTDQNKNDVLLDKRKSGTRTELNLVSFCFLFGPYTYFLGISGSFRSHLRYRPRPGDLAVSADDLALLEVPPLLEPLLDSPMSDLKTVIDHAWDTEKM